MVRVTQSVLNALVGTLLGSLVFLATRKFLSSQELVRVSFPKDLWDRYWGSAVVHHLLANFFPIPSNSPKSLYESYLDLIFVSFLECPCIYIRPSKGSFQEIVVFIFFDSPTILITALAITDQVWNNHDCCHSITEVSDRIIAELITTDIT